MKKVAIVQARMGSTRLPGKVLKDVSGKPILWHVIDRLRYSNLIDEIIIATSTNHKDDAILKFATENGIKSYAGSENDVLDRYYQTAKKFRVEIIVRITADCPLLDPHEVDKVIRRFTEGDFDYVNPGLDSNYPDGVAEVEVFTFKALEKAWKEAKKPSEREHVTPYIWNHPKKFKLGKIQYKENLSHMRWVVDVERDLTFVREIYKRLYKNGKIFHMEDVLKLLKEHPELMEINQGIIRNEGYLRSLKKDQEISDDSNFQRFN